MKKILLFAIMLIFVQLLKAQPSYSISGGIKMIEADQRTVSLFYIDESPSHDNLSTSGKKQVGNMSYELAFRIQDHDINKKLHFFVDIEGYMGSINGLDLNSGFFFSDKNQGKIKIQPEMSLLLGYSSNGIGEIENNSIYIQVNDTKFKDYTNVNVSLQNIYYGIKPGLRFIVKTGVKSEIGLGVNYQLSLKSGIINFSGTGEDGKSASDSESLTESNVGFYVDGVKSNKIPYNPDGLEFKVFYSF